MNIFSAEYGILLIFIVIALWRMLKDMPDVAGRKERRRAKEGGVLAGADGRLFKRKKRNKLP